MLQKYNGVTIWWTPAPGTHEILISDDRGLSSRRLLVVRQRP